MLIEPAKSHSRELPGWVVVGRSPSWVSALGVCIHTPAVTRTFPSAALVLLSPFQVEFPEARIYEETLNVLLYETPRVPDNSLLEATSRSRSQASQSEDDDGFELRDRVRRIHVKRYSTYDDRQIGH